METSNTGRQSRAPPIPLRSMGEEADICRLSFLHLPSGKCLIVVLQCRTKKR
jgi:hypothetical protein